MADEPIAAVIARVDHRWAGGYTVDSRDAVTLAREVVRLTEENERWRDRVRAMAEDDGVYTTEEVDRG